MSTGPTSNQETDTKSKTGDAAETPFAMSLTMITFLGIAFFNALELIFMVMITFKRYSGLYFWSVLIAASGIPVYCVGFTLKFFVTNVPNMNYVGLAIVIVGWIPMVTGQSLALYSRLNLVVHDHRKLRWVLYMIIFNALAFHGTTTGLSFAAESSTRLAAIYSAYEKAELLAFAVQECIISGLYIYETYKILRPTNAAQGKRITAVRRNLIYVNVVVICLDVALIAIEMANQYKIQTTLKALVYSVKLGLEFSVLNTLLRAIQGHGAASYSYDTGSRSAHPHRSANPAETFRGTQKTSAGACQEHPTTFSNVGKGDRAAGAGAWEMNDINIMKTTEVYVDSTSGHDVDDDTESGSPKEHRAASKASSEIHLASNGVYHSRD
ncbi:putative integral membrane protein [Neofusicoccum parvum UCRNP2]|uniref:Integral membrane protein n=2 Tax=Neofusicoccum parvum TaxID=310453 RepID=A0ACB5S083_9PEZI|nr:putative integral membrane protein [Neofusicoccum parvum UCRNP2]GME26125.1 Integral membrane protein [Neofusicoccum parvum]